MRRLLVVVSVALVSCTAAAPVVAAAKPAPVVYLVFDEFAVASLMDASGAIDEVRYPNFAALGSTSTWYRNATTVADGTGYGVPAALAGALPRRGALPSNADYPTSAFSVLAPTHRVIASEPITTLCCPSRPGARPAFVRRTPTEAALLRGQRALFHAVGLSLLAERRMATFQTFIDALRAPSTRASAKPVAYVAHLLSPHIPWRFQPDGHEYAFFVPPIPGLEGDTYGPRVEQADRAWARHLLQLGDMDRRLGLLVERLREVGLWDDALVVMTADHGVAFGARSGRREVDASNLGGVAGIPFFVKRPGQKRGAVVDAHVENIDMLPTVAAALGLKRPPGVDGRSVLGVKTGASPVRVYRSTSVRGCCTEQRFALSRFVMLRTAVVARQIARFGAGEGWPRVFEQLGVRPTMNEVAVADSKVGKASPGSFTLDTTVPVAAESGGISGIVTGLDADADVAVVVGGRILTTTQLYRARGRTRFAVVVPVGAADANVRVATFDRAARVPRLRFLRRR